MSKSFTIRERKTQRGAVSQGARLLDAKRPGWEKTVHGAIVNRTFDMTNWDSCVAGAMELYKSRDPDGGWEPVIAFNGLKFIAYSEKARWCGFISPQNVPDNKESYEDAYVELEDLWQAEVEKRLANA